MSKKLSLIKWLLAAAPIAALLSSCVIPANRGALSGVERVIISASEEEENAKEREGRRRRGTSTKRFSGSPCGDDDDCYDICEDIFNPDDDSENEGKVKACARTNKKYVLQFEDINEAFEDPEHISELELIDESAFTVMMDISASPWIEMTESAQTREAKILLVWIAKNKQIAKAINEAQDNYEEYDSYEGVKNLLEQVAPNNLKWRTVWKCRIYFIGLGAQVLYSSASPPDDDVPGAKISGGKTFMDIYEKEDNGEAKEICDAIYAEACDSFSSPSSPPGNAIRAPRSCPNA